MEEINPQPLKTISSLLPDRYKKPVVKVKATERGDLLKYFTERINVERDGKKYKKVSIGFTARKLAHLSIQDMYYLKSTCQDASNRGYSWSKCFFGSLKPK